MDSPRSLNNKNLYKLFITIIKFIPITLLVIFIIGFVLNYYGNSSFIINCIGGTSLIFLTLLYLISEVFRFCYLYRLPLHFITLVNGITILAKLEIIPISSIVWYRILAILLGLFLIVYIWYMYKNRNTPKVDYIKDLCKRYCYCE